MQARSLNAKIGTKLVASILLMVFIAFAVTTLIFFRAYRNTLIDDSAQIMQARADSIAENIDTQNIQVAAIVRSMASWQENGGFGDRETTVTHTRDLLERFPSFLGTYINYEPNADGQDGQYTANSDCCTNGRFLPYWYWNDGVLRDEMLIAPTVDLEGSEWYGDVKTLFHEVGAGENDDLAYLNITDPFIYEGVPMVSVTYPIEIGGDFVGITGVDRSLSQMYELINTFKPYESSNLYLLSRSGSFVTTSHEDVALDGTALLDHPELSAIFSQNVAARSAGVVEGTSPLTSEDAFFTFAPIETGQWMVIMEVDRSEILAPVNATIGRVALVALLAFLAISTAIWYTTNRNIIQPMQHLGLVFDAIQAGNYDARVQFATQDEWGSLGHSLNAMLDNTLVLVQSQEERDAIEASIHKLLDEVSTVAEGDLTAEAEVSMDMTGAIADSFNWMIEELRDIIERVQETSLQVSSSANEIQATAEHLAMGSETQAAQIVDTSAAIDEMSVSIQQVSENSSLSASIGEQARISAERGTSAVTDTIDGMRRIRQQVQETSKRVKRLGESTQEISDAIAVIRGIAKRTGILALNASIQASRAGEAGRGFAVVAEEVERLSERSAQAAQQIGHLVNTIQSEMKEVATSMEATTHEVVGGSDLANQAGEALVEIQDVSNHLAELIQSTSQAAQQQARGSEAIARAMNDIAQVTQQTAAGTKEASVSISNLAQLAEELRASVSRFKLRGQNEYGLAAAD